MRKKTETLLRQLSEIYDTDNRDTYITVYFNKLEDPKFISRREHACIAALPKNEKQNFQDTLQTIKQFLHKTTEYYGAIFASAEHKLFKSITLPMPVYNALIVDTSPYIRPLARIIDEWESFTLLLLDSHSAKIIDISLGSVDKQTNLNKDIMQKHKKGGQSQARFQRIRQGAIHTFLKEVVEALSSHPDHQIILAGPGTTKIQLRDMLPKHIREKVIEIVDIDLNDEQQLLQQSFKIVAAHETDKSTSIVQQLQKEILTDGLAVFGLKETLKAAQQGKIDVLIVEKDYKVKGCICEQCQIIRSGPIKDCPVCGQPSSEADVIEEIIEYAKRTNGSIEFSNDPLITNLGHIGALLRFK
jgi:peptide chain release factor subunit 1